MKHDAVLRLKTMMEMADKTLDYSQLISSALKEDMHLLAKLEELMEQGQEITDLVLKANGSDYYDKSMMDQIYLLDSFFEEILESLSYFLSQLPEHSS
ncbi:MAG: hypothetical protein PHT89_11315 [Lachnospiraceae bacterium]|nr:hypothetical protein [Lachnospiraceae bacterium]